LAITSVVGELRNATQHFSAKITHKKRKIKRNKNGCEDKVGTDLKPVGTDLKPVETGLRSVPTLYNNPILCHHLHKNNPKIPHLQIISLEGLLHHIVILYRLTRCRLQKFCKDRWITN
jgi:hypothetical protein